MHQHCNHSSCDALAAIPHAVTIVVPELLSDVTAQVAKTGNTFGVLEVGKDNLRRIIGPQGSVIKGLEADSNSRLSIDDAGLVHIYSPTEADYQTAVASIEGITGASIKVRRHVHGHNKTHILYGFFSILQMYIAVRPCQGQELLVKERRQVWWACD